MPQTVPCHGGAGGSFSGAFTLAGSFSAAFTLADVRSPTCSTSCLLALLARAQEPVRRFSYQAPGLVQQEEPRYSFVQQ